MMGKLMSIILWFQFAKCILDHKILLFNLVYGMWGNVGNLLSDHGLKNYYSKRTHILKFSV